VNNSQSSLQGRAWLDVDLTALIANARSYAARINAPLLPMVKANGYGLGAVEVARALMAVEPWGFGVATLEEAAELRSAGIDLPVVVFSPLLPARASAFAAAGVRPVIGDVAALHAWNSITHLPCHIEIDTGMSRNGIRWDDQAAIATIADVIKQRPFVEGIFTHFHSAEHDAAATELQWQRLQGAITDIGTRPPMVHAANSAAARYGTRYAGDLGRPGIHLYGGAAAGFEVRPVAALRGTVVAVRRLAAGDSVSYDATWRTPVATSIATVGIGYADGVTRRLSDRGLVSIEGRNYPIVGRVTMDHLMADIGDHSVVPGAVATLFGEGISLDEQARLAETISYEILTSIGSRVVRHYQGAS
jgi:alanine racemase